MAIRPPRSARWSRSGRLSTSVPWWRMPPDDTFTALGSRPITACAVIDLPDPDSPTTQRISPL